MTTRFSILQTRNIDPKRKFDVVQNQIRFRYLQKNLPQMADFGEIFGKSRNNDRTLTEFLAWN